MDYKKMYEEQKEEYDKLKAKVVKWEKLKQAIKESEDDDEFNIWDFLGDELDVDTNGDEETQDYDKLKEENKKLKDTNDGLVWDLQNDEKAYQELSDEKEKYEEENEKLKQTIKQLEFSLSATEDEKSPTTKLSDIVFDIKEKISDEDYKSYMESLQELNKKETTPKFVKLYHIKGYNHINQHTDSEMYKTNMLTNDYTWHADDEVDEDSEKLILKHLNVSLIMEATTEIYEIVAHDEINGYYINPDKSKIRLNHNGEMYEDIKVGNIIYRGDCRAFNTTDIFIIKELI